MSKGYLKYINDRSKVPTKIVNLILYVCMALAALGVHGGAQAPPTARVEPAYEVIIEKSIFVPARDGVRLALDLYRPSQDGSLVNGKFPTLLVRTPYDKS